jgi:hypothetical protein
MKSNIIIEEIAKTIRRLPNSKVLELDKILNKALNTYRELIAY